MSDEKKPARRPRIEEQKPFAVTQALRVFAETGDVQKAAEVAGCHVRTIRLLIAKDDGFCQAKKTLAEQAFVLSAAAQEVTQEKVSTLDGYRAALVAKMSAQSGLELTNWGTPLVPINLGDLEECRRTIEACCARLGKEDSNPVTIDMPAASSKATNGEGGETKDS